MCNKVPETDVKKNTDMVFHPESHSNKWNMTKWGETKTSMEQSKKTTNQSATIVLAAVYTSHQVWCLQRLSERAAQNSINSWQRMQMNPNMWWSGIKETIENHDKHEVMTLLCMLTHSLTHIKGWMKDNTSTQQKTQIKASGKQTPQDFFFNAV